MLKNKRMLAMVLCICILLGVTASFTVIFKRMMVEKNANTVAFSVEYTQLKDMAAREGLSVAGAIDYLQNYEGKPLISGVVYKEPVLNDMQNDGILQVLSGYEVSQKIYSNDLKISNPTPTQEEADNGIEYLAIDFTNPESFDYNFIICPTQELQKKIYKNLTIKTMAKTKLIDFKVGKSNRVYGVVTSMPHVDLVNMGVGFPTRDLEVIKSKNLQCIIQLKSWQKVNGASIDFVLSNLKEYGVVAVGFNDPELPGYSQRNWPEISKLFADKLTALDLPLLTAEFFAQKGLNDVASKMDFRVARMHPVSEADLAKLSPKQLADRFQLATSERNMGIALARVYSKLSLEENAGFLKTIVDAVEAKGTTIGSIGLTAEMKLNPLVLILVTLATAAGGFFLLYKLNLKKWCLILPLLALAVALGLLLIGKIGMVQKLVALGAVMIYPTLGVILFSKSKPQRLGKAMLLLLAMTGVSLVGAILMVGILSTRSYMTGVTIFSGVKLAQMVPLLVLACYFWFKSYYQKDSQSISLVYTAATYINKPVTYGILLLGVVALAVLAAFMLRSGNDAVAVSGFERSFRSFMDQVMVVRPRTKEFLFGYPLLLWSLYYGYGRNLWPATVFGAISLVSLVNTFQHLHTPLWASVLRTVNGLVLGLALGILLIFVTKLIVGYITQKLKPQLEEAQAKASGRARN